MTGSLLPVVFCVFIWWIGTGIVLRLNSLSEHTYPRNRAAMTLLAGMVLIGVLSVRTSTGLAGAYVGFIAAIILWGWLEFLHYSGWLLGPRVQACPPGVSGSRRFVCALQAMFYRELAVAAVGVLLISLSAGSPNKVALYTFLVLWLMRLSAELNVFFGVGYLPEHWLPRKLQYLMTYRGTRKYSLFFPLSVTLAVGTCIWIFVQLPDRSIEPFRHTSSMLVGTLLCLAVVEHLLLVVPNNGAALWSWAHSGRVAEKSNHADLRVT